jgi:hypothetical protein
MCVDGLVVCEAFSDVIGKEYAVCRLSRLAVLFGIYGLGMCASADDAAWTTLRGRIIVDGDLPDSAPIDVTRDREYCGVFGLTDQSFVVHPGNRGLKNVAIFLRTKTDLPIHPSYDQSRASPVKLDNIECQFVPRMELLRTGQTWQVSSSDPIPHNVAVYARRNDPFSQVIPQNKSLNKVFDNAESVPVRIDCSIHAWMRAYIVITDHPYAAVTDANGYFEIAHVPRGIWTFRFWHERPGYLKTVKQSDQALTLKSGSWEIQLDGDVLDLGKISVDSMMFAE